MTVHSASGNRSGFSRLSRFLCNIDDGFRRLLVGPVEGGESRHCECEVRVEWAVRAQRWIITDEVNRREIESKKINTCRGPGRA